MFENFDYKHSQYVTALTALRGAQEAAGLDTSGIDDQPTVQAILTQLFDHGQKSAQERPRNTTIIHLEYILRRKADELLATLPRNERMQLARIPIGILPQKTIRATAHREGFIAVSMGLTSALHALCKLLCYLLRPQVPLDDPVASELVIRCLRGLHARSSITFPKIGLQFLHPESLEVSMNLLHVQEAFLISHEYGHVVCDHLDDHSVKEGTQIAAEEIEADERAYSMIETYLKAEGRDLETGFAAIDIFLTAQWLAEHIEWSANQSEHYSLSDESYEDTGMRLFEHFLFQPTVYHVPGIARRSSLHNWLYDRNYLPGLDIARDMDREFRRLVEFNLHGNFDRVATSSAADRFLNECHPTM
jgi:hypothetical protein